VLSRHDYVGTDSDVLIFSIQNLQNYIAVENVKRKILLNSRVANKNPRFLQDDNNTCCFCSVCTNDF
jgi:hypothetical protein